MTHRILVVDGDREKVRLVRAYLERSDYEVLVAYDGETALHVLRQDHPDLMLLDLMLPERDAGRDAWDVAGVAPSKVGLAALPVVGLELGSDDSADKSFNPGEVVAHVRAVLHRVQGERARRKVIQVGSLTVDPDARRVAVAGQVVHLTPTEFGLLCALAEQPGRALTRQEMIENGVGTGYDGLERTVDSHVKNLRQKLDGAGGAAHLIETVFGIGYRLDVGDQSNCL